MNLIVTVIILTFSGTLLYLAKVNRNGAKRADAVHISDVEYKYGLNSPTMYAYKFDDSGYDTRSAAEIQKSKEAGHIYLQGTETPFTEEEVIEFSKMEIPKMLVKLHRYRSKQGNRAIKYSQIFHETPEGNKIISAKAYVKYVLENAPVNPQQSSLFVLETFARKGAADTQERKLTKMYAELDKRQKLLADKL